MVQDRKAEQVRGARNTINNTETYSRLLWVSVAALYRLFAEVHVGSGLMWAICMGMDGIVTSKVEMLANMFGAFER